MNLIEYQRMYNAEDQHWWYVGLHELILATVQRESQRLGRTLTIFDAGCGTGRLCQLLTEAGHSVSGCDASQEALRLCTQRGVGDVFPANLNTLELEPETYDVITSIDVLYHSGITDDVAVMRRLRTGLRPGGVLILNLVAHEYLRSTHDIAVHTRERYTRKMLQERLMKAGFTIDLLSYRVCALYPLIAMYRLWLRLSKTRSGNEIEVDSDVFLPNRLTNTLLLSMIRSENRLIGMMPLPFGSSLFTIARNIATQKGTGA